MNLSANSAITRPVMWKSNRHASSSRGIGQWKIAEEVTVCGSLHHGLAHLAQ